MQIFAVIILSAELSAVHEHFITRFVLSVLLTNNQNLKLVHGLGHGCPRFRRDSFDGP